MNLEHELAKRQLQHAINGMLGAIADAANPDYPLWSPYRGDIVNVANFYVRHVVRQARKLGLYSDADMERAA